MVEANASAMVSAGWGLDVRFLAVMCCIGLAIIPNFTEGIQQIGVPSYTDTCLSPGCLNTWEVVKADANIVIINPNSGPVFSEVNTLNDYMNLVTNVKKNSSVTKVLGYVSTTYTQRASSTVLSEIDVYYRNFSTNIDGIFLDDGNTSCAATTTYKLYDDRVKSHWGSSGFTALTWGTVGPECYLNNTNINTFCTYEGSYSNYISPAYASSPDWVFRHNASLFWHIVYSTPNNGTSVQAGVSLSKTRHAGIIYFTDPSDNPYDDSPSTTVWQTEVTQAKL